MPYYDEGESTSSIPQSFILVGYQHSPEAPGSVLIPKELAALFRQITSLFDLTCGSDKAAFQSPSMEQGQSPEGCSSFMFPRIMEPAKSNEMLLAGCKLTAVEARDCGLVTDVFSHDKFTEEVQNRIQAMAKLAKQL